MATLPRLESDWGAIPLDFDPGQLLADADALLEGGGFEDW